MDTRETGAGETSVGGTGETSVGSTGETSVGGTGETSAGETSMIGADLSDAGGCRRRLSIRVLSEEVAREFEETVRRYSRAVRMPGFRRGKVPHDIVRKRFAHEIEEEVRDHVLRHGLREAFERHKVSPLHNPAVEVGPIKDGEAFTCTALFEVKPELRLGE